MNPNIFAAPPQGRLAHVTCTLCKRPITFTDPLPVIGETKEEADSRYCSNAGVAMLQHLSTAHEKEMQIVNVITVMMQTFAVFQHFEFEQEQLVQADEILAKHVLDYVHNDTGEEEPTPAAPAPAALPPAPRPPR